MTASQVNGMPTAFPPPPPPPQPQGAPTHSLTHQANPYQSTPGQPMYGAHANNGQFEPYSTQTSQSNSLAFDYAQLPAVSTPSVSFISVITYIIYHISYIFVGSLIFHFSFIQIIFPK